MHEAIAWSHDLLEPSQRALFRRLAVFVDGFTPESVEAVCRQEDGAGGADLSAIEGLFDASLLVRVAGDEPRFRMLETIRDYAGERLTEAGEEARVRDAHAAYFLALARKVESHLIAAGSGVWLERLVIEWANVREAVNWSAGLRPR